MKSEFEPRQFTALVLAADRSPADPVAAMAGTGCKALVPVAGVPMVRRVIEALEASDRIDRIVLVGPARHLLAQDASMTQLLDTARISWLEPASSPSTSAAQALARQPADRPVLVTTADHALLCREMVDYFLQQAAAGGHDFVVAVTPLDTVLARFPGTRRTSIRLRGGPYCGSNLFAFMTEDARRLASYWQRVEQDRKHPRRVIAGALGLGGVLRYLLGRLTLEQALQQLSARLGVSLGAVIMPFAEAAIDVDSPLDYQMVERFHAQRNQSIPSDT
ncbi:MULTISPECIES: nucleotidyltransferase family protein [Pseudomonas]|jgi:CTP:molybdopterin cytidylyltransferase MocA|uniref:nucleotidyltransferase family protein n=1 Tax=Pseudomonas TaxID=286 RepID=UPI00062B2184|nr:MULTISPECIES: nucleotidyltransferase family protein [Pseudomonas]KKX69071.1 MobA-like NTP transferase domain containing protein [Pseudomonas putida]MCK8657353.1 nucleotidyltransferase family protein [Pseudomonas umsongensis]NBB60541.1 NTP transferase domain-containing protein [Pseudomonas sp. ODNR1LW]OMQ41117.1 MobA-like NTP transferase domain containing protein [Pseudomonas putida]